MQYVGAENSIQSDPVAFVPEAQAAYSGLTSVAAASLLLNIVTAAGSRLVKLTAFGKLRVTSAVAQDFLDSMCRAMAYREVYVSVYGADALPAETKSAVEKTIAALESRLTAMKDEGGWDVAAADAYAVLLAEKRKALEAGNLNDPVFTDAERRLYQSLARSGELAKAGIPLTSEAQTAIAVTPIKTGMGAMGWLALAGAAAVAFFTLR
jgi:hypothetical protein